MTQAERARVLADKVASAMVHFIQWGEPEFALKDLHYLLWVLRHDPSARQTIRAAAGHIN